MSLDDREEHSHRGTPEVLLESNNPLDVSPEDLEEIANHLEEVVPGASVEIGYDEQHGAGVTGHEVLIFWVPNAEALRDGLYVALITAAVDQVKKRFKREHSSRRTKVIIIHDKSTGDEIETLVIESEKTEPTVRPASARSLRRRLPTQRQRGRHRR